MINLLLIASGTVSILLSGIVYLKGRLEASNLSFLLLALSMSLWAWSYVFYNNPIIFDYTFWMKLINFSGVLIVAGIFYFAHTFPTNRLPPLWLQGLFLLLNGWVVYELYFTPDFITGVDLISAGPETRVGMFYPAVAVIWISFTALSIYKLVRNYLTSVGNTRMQFLYIFTGLTIATIAAIVFDAIFPLYIGTSQYFPLSAASSIFFVGLTSYAIVRNKLFDIRLLIARSLAYALLVVTMAALYALGIFGISSLIFENNLGSLAIRNLVYAGLAVVLAFTFQPLSRLFTKLTDKVFYKDRYDPQELLSSLSHIMAVNFQLEPLLSLLLAEITDKLRLARGSFVLVEGEKIYLTKVFGYNFSFTPRPSEIKALSKEPKILVTDDLPEGGLKELLRKFGAALSAPLVAEKDFVGLIFLGEKRSGEILSDQDIKVIEIVAPEISVAIANAKSVDKIERFNVILKDEVDQATKELRRANSELMRLDQLKDEFFSIATHELRTPLTAIRGNAQLIEEYFGEKIRNKDFKEMLSAIEVNSDRLVNIVGEYLNMSRLEQGRMKFAFAQVDIGTLATELTHDLEGSLTAKGLTLKIEGDAPKAWADPDKVKEVLVNLVGNAIKFTDHGGITVRVSRDPAGVKTEVTDTGEGIPKENQILLFKKYQQAGKDSLTKVDQRGTGLGLYISKLMVEAMKGKVWLESSVEGEGTTFAFTLPAASGKEKAESEELRLPALSKA